MDYVASNADKSNDSEAASVDFNLPWIAELL